MLAGAGGRSVGIARGRGGLVQLCSSLHVSAYVSPRVIPIMPRCRFYPGCLVGGLRKLQGYSLASIYHEYRLFTGKLSLTLFIYSYHPNTYFLSEPLHSGAQSDRFSSDEARNRQILKEKISLHVFVHTRVVQ